MSGMRGGTARRRIGALAAAGLLALAAGCGGGSDGGGTTATGTATGAGTTTAPSGPHPPAPLRPGTTPAAFAANFAHVTGILPVPERDPFGTRFAIPEEPDRWPRLGVFGLTWASEERRRGVLLDGRPDAEGRRWRTDATGSYTVARAFGPDLVASSPQGERPEPTEKWLRLERALQAATSGDLAALPPAEQPCEARGLDPLAGPTGACAVAGMPTTFVEATDELRTPALEARVTGVETTAEIEPSTAYGTGTTAAGRFVVVAFEVRNVGDRPIPFLDVRLRVGEEAYEEDLRARAALPPSSGTLPLPPNATLEARIAFDVPEDVAARAGEGALVLPAGRDDEGDPDVDVEEGWIRLASAARSLPDVPVPPGSTTPPRAPAPPPGARAYAPPAIPLERGRGPEIGAVARLQYVAASFFPMPTGFRSGGIPVGSRAGACRVPALADDVRDALQRQARSQTPGGTIAPLTDGDVLLADCGAAGRWAMVTWRQTRGGDETIWVDELRDEGGGTWSGTPRGVQPGCRMPLDAAAAWELDVTPCGAAPGRVRPPPSATPPPAPSRPRAPRPRGAPRDPAPAPRRAPRPRRTPDLPGTLRL